MRYTFEYKGTLAFLMNLSLLPYALQTYFLLRWHHLPLFQRSVLRTFPQRLLRDCTFTVNLLLELPWSTSVLNHNTLPTIHNTELIRLSTRWFQRKQSRSKGSVLLRKGLK
ncbi:hypothetical protein QL285_003661 [Trifolium repens]|nr:hypothetical protein QL285_003661 [Trifolium repens]